MREQSGLSATLQYWDFAKEGFEFSYNEVEEESIFTMSIQVTPFGAAQWSRTVSSVYR